MPNKLFSCGPLPTASPRGCSLRIATSRCKIALCFRFQRLTGYCHVQLFMLDFSLEPSEQCVKDYLLLGGRWRYCGESLQSTASKWVQVTLNSELESQEKEGPWLLLSTEGQWADMQVWHNTPKSESQLHACYISRNKINHNVLRADRRCVFGLKALK